MSHSYAIESVHRALEEFIAGDTSEDRQRRAKAGQFHYIPLQLSRFYEQLDAALQLRSTVSASTLRFIDVGCGMGGKVLAAKIHNRNLITEGVEIEKRYVTVARKLMASQFGDGTNGRWEIHQGCAITFDYSPYDIIYFYRPLSDTKLEKRLETHIQKTAKPGALILVNASTDLWNPNKQFTRIYGSNIYERRSNRG